MPKKTKKKTKNSTNSIHHSPPTLQLQELGGSKTACVTCPNQFGDRNSADLSQMEDSSNGKLEEAQKFHPEGAEVVEFVREVSIESYAEPAKEPREGDDSSSSSSSSSSDEEEEAGEKISPEVEVDEKEVSVSVVETVEYVPEQLDETIVDNLGLKEEVVLSLEETDESTPAVVDVVEKQTEETTLTSLNGESAPVIEETEVVCVEEREEVPPAVADVVSFGTEETKLVALEEKTGETSEVLPPIESADAGEDYGKREIPETAGNPPIVSVTGGPLHPTSWRSCCGLFEVLHRSDR